ncbi:hypothetical protein PENARI_c054G00913 [Penicillium arizonense]|uniref:DUF7580 domain-containing protein n=1 Tax=Penicillium arizonense TaxID=1835702 RepID=A0A1F5L2K1_PENAI|nr:hypothetical protein PENARI_c054G00913 [Penicillium arizonense]OGE47220.1 hypothetical protein PENARI_c054G00913 [Penicillium arizonense]
MDVQSKKEVATPVLEPRTPISSLLELCTCLFATLISTLSSQDSPTHLVPCLQEELSRLRVWAGNLGAQREENDEQSLEYSLKDAPELRREVIDHFHDLSEAIQEATSIASGEEIQFATDTSDSENEISDPGRVRAREEPKHGDGDYHELEEYLEDIRHTVTSLSSYRFANTLENPAGNVRVWGSADVRPYETDSPILWDIEGTAIPPNFQHSTADVMDKNRNEYDEIRREPLQLQEMMQKSEEMLLNIEGGADFDFGKELHGLISVKEFDDITLNDRFACKEADNMKSHRPRGVLDMDDKKFEVWFEWKSVDNVTKGSSEDKKSRLLTAILAQMLHSNKPQHFYSPKCIGYVDDRERHNRYGWVFMMPKGSVKDTTLKSLHTILGQSHFKPTLAQRISLAWKLASTLLYLHSANWLHNGIHSGNVVFSFDGETFDVEKPILSGFEYSRPQSHKTTYLSLDPIWDIYRWPGIQIEASKADNPRRTYDIYSLGLVLLEVAHWKPLHEMMRLKKWPEPSSQDCRIRAWLLGEERFPPFKRSNPLLELRDIAGEKYWKATNRCLVAHGEMGMCIQEEADQAHGTEIGVRLHEAFTNLVVDELKGEEHVVKLIPGENNSTLSLTTCADASIAADSAQAKGFEDIVSEHQPQQIIVSTLGDLISARRVVVGPRDLRCIGQRSDETRGKLPQDTIGRSSGDNLK